MATIPQQLSLPVQVMRLSGSINGRPIPIDDDGATDLNDSVNLHDFSEYTDPAWPYIDRIWLWFCNQTDTTRLVYLTWRPTNQTDTGIVIPVQLAPYETRLVSDGWVAQYLGSHGGGNSSGISAYANSGDELTCVAVGHVLRHFQVGDPTGVTP